MRQFIPLVAALLAFPAPAAVNVNTAQQSDLQRTKGLDKHKAKAIIDWRNENGPIDNFEELKQVPGFTEDVIEKAKTELAFSGDAYTPPPKPVKAAKKPDAKAAGKDARKP